MKEKKCQIIICISFLVYAIGFLIGLIVEYSFIDTASSSISDYQKLLTIHNESHFKSFLWITENNIIVILKNVILGIFSFGIFSLVFVFYNAYIHGYIIKSLFPLLGTQDMLCSTIPHSIELIPLILSVLLGFSISNKIILHKNILSVKKTIQLSMACIIITIVAAFIETHISMI